MSDPFKHGSVAQALRNLAAALASEKSLPPPAQPPKPLAFDPDRVWIYLRTLPDPKVHAPLMRFAGWLWKTGIHDMDVLMALLEDRCKRNPANAYAYYAKGGPGRVELAAQASSVITELEHRQRMAEDPMRRQ